MLPLSSSKFRFLSVTAHTQTLSFSSSSVISLPFPLISIFISSFPNFYYSLISVFSFQSFRFSRISTFRFSPLPPHLPFSLTRSLTPSRRPSLPHLSEPSRLLSLSFFFPSLIISDTCGSLPLSLALHSAAPSSSLLYFRLCPPSSYLSLLLPNFLYRYHSLSLY